MKTSESLRRNFPEITWIGMTDGKAIQREVEKYIQNHAHYIEAISRDSAWKAYYRYPAYKSKRFFRFLKRQKMTLDEFRVNLEYINAVKDGWIKNDEWNLDREILPEERLKLYD